MNIKFKLEITYTNLTGFFITLIGIVLKSDTAIIAGVGLIGLKKGADIFIPREEK